MGPQSAIAPKPGIPCQLDGEITVSQLRALGLRITATSQHGIRISLARRAPPKRP